MSQTHKKRPPTRAMTPPAQATQPARPNRRTYILVATAGVLVVLWLFTLPLRARLAHETALQRTEIQRREREEAANRTEQVAPAQATQAVPSQPLPTLSAPPNDSKQHLQLSSLYARQGDYRSAIAEARTAQKLAPKSADPHKTLGDLYDRVGDIDLEQDELKKALTLRPNDANAAALLAYQYLYMGWTRQAEALLRRSLSRNPLNANLHATLGLVAFQEQNLATAEHELLAVRRLAPEDSSVFAPLFDVYQFGKKPADAMRVVEEALTRKPDDPGLLARKAQAFLDLGDPGHAMEAANQTLQVDGNFMNALYVRALAEQRGGDRAAAIRDLQQVADNAPAAQTFLQLGRLYLEAGEKSKGLLLLDQGKRAQAALAAVAHDIAGVNARPNDPAAHLAAARSYVRDHEDARAIVELKQTLKLRPSDTAARDLLKQELLARHRTDEAQSLP